MRFWLVALAVVGACSAPGLAGEHGGKVILENWEVAYLGNGKAGYVRTVAKEVDKDGQKLIQTTVELRLRLKRSNDLVELSNDTGTLETTDGKVVGTFMRQYLGQKQTLLLTGTVVGKQLQLVMNGDTQLKPAPWNDDVVGLYKQQSMFKNRNLKPGDTFTYRSFEPNVNLVLNTEVSAKGYRDVALKGSNRKQKLLLVETAPEKVEFKRGKDTVEKLQLPILSAWLDDAFDPVKSEVDIPALGHLVMYRTTKAAALAPAPLAQVDIGLSHMVRLKNRILQPYDTSAAVYRVTIRNDTEPASAFSRDDRQTVKNVRGNTFELHVKASTASRSKLAEEEPGAEFVQSSYFINCDDAKVKELARRAVGAETDPWRKSLRIEKWVNANMRATNHETLATADHVARTLTGDCTEYSMLTAAMCRAVGVPSRTAIGLIYADVKGAPCFAFHMWTEVWNKGRWIPIDATLGKGYVGATHLKINDSSWHDERTMTPIFPLMRILGQLEIDVLSAEGR